MKYAWLLIGIFAARVLVSAIAYPGLDGDLGWQAWLGRSILATHAIPHALGAETYTAPGAAWVPQEWLFAVGVAWGKSGDAAWCVFAGAIALCAVAALAIAAADGAARGAAPIPLAVATAFGGVTILESIGVRAQVVAWPCIALLMFLLARRSRAVWFVVPLTALWSNLHASMLLAPIVVFAAALGEWLDAGRRPTPHVRRLAVVGALALVATCANPLGVRLPLYSVHLFGDSALRGLITEWQITQLKDFSFAYGALVLLILILVAGTGPRRRYADLIPLAAFAYLLLGAGRNIVLFGIVALPYAAAALTVQIQRIWPARPLTAEGLRQERIARVALPAFGAVVATVLAAVLLADGEGRHPDTNFDRASAAIAAIAQPRSVFCEDFAWCSFLIGGTSRVYLDGRADPYPDSLWREYGDVLHLAPHWMQRLRARGTTVIVAKRGAVFDQAVALSGGWRSVYRDKRYEVWSRSAIVALR